MSELKRLTDDALMMRYKDDGDESAFDVLYLRYAGQLFTRLYCVLRVICARCNHRVPLDSKGHPTGLIKVRLHCIHCAKAPAEATHRKFDTT